MWLLISNYVNLWRPKKKKSEAALTDFASLRPRVYLQWFVVVAIRPSTASRQLLEHCFPSAFVDCTAATRRWSRGGFALRVKTVLCLLLVSLGLLLHILNGLGFVSGEKKGPHHKHEASAQKKIKERKKKKKNFPNIAFFFFTIRLQSISATATSLASNGYSKFRWNGRALHRVLALPLPVSITECCYKIDVNFWV